MSKNSVKTNYEQLLQWLSTLGKNLVNKEKATTNLSKVDYYKSKGVK